MLSKNSMYCWPGVSFISSKDSNNFGFLHGGGGKLGGPTGDNWVAFTLHE
jgi:hypothetical protein